jgi:antirestriction protein ArdC
VDAEHVMDNSAAYLASWVPVIRDDPKMLIGAASQGQKAADLILEPSREAEHQDQDEARRQDEAGPIRDRQADRDIEAA